jgi:hypothetical protein
MYDSINPLLFDMFHVEHSFLLHIENEKRGFQKNDMFHVEQYAKYKHREACIYNGIAMIKIPLVSMVRIRYII